MQQLVLDNHRHHLRRRVVMIQKLMDIDRGIGFIVCNTGKGTG